MEVESLKLILQYSIYPIAAFAFYQYKQLIKRTEILEAKHSIQEKEVVRLEEKHNNKVEEIKELKSIIKEVDTERHEVNKRMATFEAELKNTHKAITEVRDMLSDFLKK